MRKASADFLEKPEVPIEPITIASLLFGSYHVLFPIKFGDGLPCMWNSRAFQTHQPHPPFGLKLSKSMRLILCETSVPLPDVLAFDATLDNELGCPSILVSFVQGGSLYDCWFDKKYYQGRDVVHCTRTSQGIAHAMVELSRFSFSTYWWCPSI